MIQLVKIIQVIIKWQKCLDLIKNNFRGTKTLTLTTNPNPKP